MINQPMYKATVSPIDLARFSVEELEKNNFDKFRHSRPGILVDSSLDKIIEQKLKIENDMDNISPDSNFYITDDLRSNSVKSLGYIIRTISDGFQAKGKPYKLNLTQSIPVLSEFKHHANCFLGLANIHLYGLNGYADDDSGLVKENVYQENSDSLSRNPILERRVANVLSDIKDRSKIGFDVVTFSPLKGISNKNKENYDGLLVFSAALYKRR